MDSLRLEYKSPRSGLVPRVLRELDQRLVVFLLDARSFIIVDLDRRIVDR